MSQRYIPSQHQDSLYKCVASIEIAHKLNAAFRHAERDAYRAGLLAAQRMINEQMRLAGLQP